MREGYDGQAGGVNGRMRRLLAVAPVLQEVHVADHLVGDVVADAGVAGVGLHAGRVARTRHQKACTPGRDSAKVTR
jgi:hypothetical protein